LTDEEVEGAAFACSVIGDGLGVRGKDLLDEWFDARGVMDRLEVGIF